MNIWTWAKVLQLLIFFSFLVVFVFVSIQARWKNILIWWWDCCSVKCVFVGLTGYGSCGTSGGGAAWFWRYEPWLLIMVSYGSLSICMLASVCVADGLHGVVFLISVYVRVCFCWHSFRLRAGCDEMMKVAQFFLAYLCWITVALYSQYAIVDVESKWW